MTSAWPRDQIVEELQTLFETGASRAALGACTQLIAALPSEVVPSEADISRKIHALEAVLQLTVKRNGEGFDISAEHVRAARELLGWTTLSADEIRQLISQGYEFGAKHSSDIATIDLTSLGARAILAGAQFSRPLTSQRSVRNRRPQIAEHLADAIWKTLNDSDARRQLSSDFGVSDPQLAEVDGQQSPYSSQPTGFRLWQSQHRVTFLILLAVGVLAVGFVVVVSAQAMQSTVSGDTGSDARRPIDDVAAPPVRQALVSYTEGIGLKTFTGPANTYPGGNPGGYLEGDVLAVVCQERNGQVIHDPTGDPNRYAEPWPVWNKLSNGLWVSDLYTDLPKVPGDTPPGGIGRC